MRCCAWVHGEHGAHERCEGASGGEAERYTERERERGVIEVPVAFLFCRNSVLLRLTLG